jgi:hypothetical protein
VDLPPLQQFMKFDRINWNKVFFKTYYEKHSFVHLLVNFNRICDLRLLVLHRVQLANNLCSERFDAPDDGNAVVL